MPGLASVSRETKFVKTLCAVVLKGNWNQLLNPQISSDLSSATVQRVQLSLDIYESYAFYEWVEKIPGYKHSLESTWSMIHMLTKNKSFRIARQLLEKIALKDYISSSTVLNALVGLHHHPDSNSQILSWLVIFYAESKMTENAIQVFEHMQTYRIRPHLHACTALLNLFVKAGLTATMWKMYKKMLKLGVVPNFHVYNVLIHGCSKSRDVEKAQELLNELESNCILPDLFTYNTLCDVVEDDDFVVLDSYNKNFKRSGGEYDMRYEMDESEFRHPLVREMCRLVELRSNWNPDLEGQLKNLLRSLKPRQICAVLHSQDDERVALEFFYWADRQWRYRHNPVVYYAMLQILGQTKLCQGARRVLQLMYRRGIYRTSEAFRYLMISYSRAGKLRHAMGVLRMMHKAGVQPNLSICNAAIHVLVVNNRLDKALKFLKRMQIVGISPDVVTYNCLIKGYCDVNLVKDAIKLIDDMVLTGCVPDKVSFYTVIHYFCREKNMAEINMLLDKMIHCNLLLDVVTYNNLIHMLSKYGHSDEAYDFVKKAQEQGFRLDKVGYTALVHSFCRDGRVDKGLEIVDEMFVKDCPPDVVTYTAVIDGFCRAGRVDEAKDKLQEMYKKGCKPNTVSYTALLNGLCQIGRSSEAQDMMNKSEEEWWTPNAITYSVLMHGFHREGKYFEACDVVREMIMKGLFPSPAEINLLLSSLCGEGRTDDAKRFIQECLSKGCDINVVNFTTVIHGLSQKDDLDGALSLLDDMYLVNKSPDIVTYTTVVDALGRRGKIEEATDLIKKMLGRGILPNPVMYRMVIHQYCQNGKVEDLLQLLEKLLLKQPYQTAYNQVIEKLCSFGFLGEAYNLLGKVLRTASRVDAQSCHVLIQSYIKRGSPLMAYKIACRMFRRNLIPDLKLCKKVSRKLTLDGNIKEADSLMVQFVERGLISPC